MSYVVFETLTTRYAGKKGKYNDPIFNSLAAAKSHMSRLIKSGSYTADQLSICEVGFFHDYVEEIVQRTNIMSGEPIFERINTPYYCSPSSETYWSM